ncbi:hypothetical protein SA18_3142 [Salmonella enterica subsp. enterica serovar Agona str. 18.H.07]|nr:hypothetical protein SA18_3142 [Salmonella enterica subsp. enterica serovar Agona str. 18.H.07]
MYDPPFLEALMITASFFAIFIIIVVSVLLLEGEGRHFYHYRCVCIAPLRGRD